MYKLKFYHNVMLLRKILEYSNEKRNTWQTWLNLVFNKNLTLRNIVQISEKSRENSKPRENVSTVRTAHSLSSFLSSPEWRGIFCCSKSKITKRQKYRTVLLVLHSCTQLQMLSHYKGVAQLFFSQWEASLQFLTNQRWAFMASLSGF